MHAGPWDLETWVADISPSSGQAPTFIPLPSDQRVAARSARARKRSAPVVHTNHAISQTTIAPLLQYEPGRRRLV